MNFLKSIHSSLIRGNFVRYYGKHNKKYLYQETDKKKYEGVTYYPRYVMFIVTDNITNSNSLFNIISIIYSKTNLEDINNETEIPKLFKVTRVKLVKGNPYWEKRILRDLGLFEVVL